MKPIPRSLARKPYPSDLSDEQWSLIEGLIPRPNPHPNFPPATHKRREIVNAILYLLRTGCQWRHLPHDLLKCQSVAYYYYGWQEAGGLDSVLDRLRILAREAEGRRATPTPGIIDSQSAKSNCDAGGAAGGEAGTGAGGTGTNLGLNKPAAAATVQSGNSAANGNDGSTTTRWYASSANVPQWWQVDLLQLCDITGSEVMWEFMGRTYNYYIEVSNDALSWQEVVNKRTNLSTAQTQNDPFMAQGRYVRITVTGVSTYPPTCACFYDFQVYGRS